MTSRRKFVKASAYLAAGSMLVPSLSCSTKTKQETGEASTPEESAPVENKDIGVQVYSVREQLKEDFEGSLKRLAEIGYKHLEAYGLGLDGMFLEKISPAEYKKIATDLGMELVSTHTTYFTSENAQKMIDASLEAGLKHLVIPYLAEELRGSVDNYKRVAENFNSLGALFNAAGLKFGYHNHAFEFELIEGQVPLEILLNETEANLVNFEADLYWITKGGMDPMDLINKFPGRFSLFHVKDANQDLEQTTVGTGIIDFETILKSRDKAGVEYYFVEDERTDDPFGNVKAAFDHLNTADFA